MYFQNINMLLSSLFLFSFSYTKQYIKSILSHLFLFFHTLSHLFLSSQLLFQTKHTLPFSLSTGVKLSHLRTTRHLLNQILIWADCISSGSIKRQWVLHDGEMTSRTPQFPPSSEMNFEEVALGLGM